MLLVVEIAYLRKVKPVILKGFLEILDNLNKILFCMEPCNTTYRKSCTLATVTSDTLIDLHFSNTIHITESGIIELYLSDD